MGLADRLQGTARRDRVLELLQTLPLEDARALVDALTDTATFTGGDISRALFAEGHNVGPSAVNHFRRKINDGRASPHDVLKQREGE